MSLALALLLQAGAYPNARPIPQPPVDRRRERAQPRSEPRAAAAALPAPRDDRLQLCLDQAAQEPVRAVEGANAWLADARGPQRIAPLRCLGTAQGQLGLWGPAEQSFAAARDASDAGDRAQRAQLGAMAGNAALAAGAAERALAVLDQAHADAAAASDIRLGGEVAIDRARALVMLKRQDEAAKTLVEARTAAADNPLAWLLSATLSRRMGKLAEAQAQIATAATLQPENPEIGPEIGLEAGVIAMLAGQREPARKSWQSVIDLAPASEAAASARGYLAQLPAKAEIRQ